MNIHEYCEWRSKILFNNIHKVLALESALLPFLKCYFDVARRETSLYIIVLPSHYCFFCLVYFNVNFIRND